MTLKPHEPKKPSKLTPQQYRKIVLSGDNVQTAGVVMMALGIMGLFFVFIPVFSSEGDIFDRIFAAIISTSLFLGWMLFSGIIYLGGYLKSIHSCLKEQTRMDLVKEELMEDQIKQRQNAQARQQRQKQQQDQNYQPPTS